MNTEQAIEKIKAYSETWSAMLEKQACIDGGSYVLLHPEEFGLVPEDDWISVDKDLPLTYDDEFSQTVLINVTTKSGTDHVSMGSFKKGEWFWHINSHQLSEGFKVTHWKKKPEPPID